MKIGTKLVVKFSIIVSTILLCFSLTIYYFSSLNRTNQFYTRLYHRAVTSAKLLTQVDELNDTLLQIINKNTVNALSGERIAIYNYLNENIYHHEKDRAPIKVDAAILNKIRLKKTYRFELQGQEALGILYFGKYDRYVVIASAYDELGQTPIIYLGGLLTVGFIITVIVILLSGLVFVKQMLKPLSEITEQARLITASNLNLRLDEGNRNDEIAQLAITFNNMLQRLEEAFESQKRFVANASHELRTPLTSIMGQIEVTLMKQRNETEYRNVLGSILEDIKNLNRLTSGLLKLAQVDAEPYKLKFEKFRADDLLWEAREEIIKNNPEYSVSIDFDEIPENSNELIIHGNKALLKTAFSNLMDNACKYSFNKKVIVRLNISEHLKIIFSDTGSGIAQDELTKVFQPFFRGERALQTPGYGLGLSLTGNIIKLHKGKIKLSSNQGIGTTVEVSFPKNNF